MQLQGGADEINFNFSCFWKSRIALTITGHGFCSVITGNGIKTLPGHRVFFEIRVTFLSLLGLSVGRGTVEIQLYF